MLGPLSKIASWQLDRLIRFFVVVSIGVHLLVALISHGCDPKPQRLLNEVAIETDLVSEADLKPLAKTVIPDAKKAEKATVPSNQLPQLNKDFAVKENTKEEEGVAPPEEKVEKPPEEARTAKEDEAEGESSPQDDEKATKLAKLDALKRLAMEEVKANQKEKQKELQTEELDTLAQVSKALEKEKGSGTESGSGYKAGPADKAYQAYLKRTIRKNWNLPKTFQLSSGDMLVSVTVRLDARGVVQKAEVSESSGSPTLDSYCVDTIKKSSPFKAPPKSLAGTDMNFNCTPN